MVAVQKRQAGHKQAALAERGTVPLCAGWCLLLTGFVRLGGDAKLLRSDGLSQVWCWGVEE